MIRYFGYITHPCSGQVYLRCAKHSAGSWTHDLLTWRSGIQRRPTCAEQVWRNGVGVKLFISSDSLGGVHITQAEQKEEGMQEASLWCWQGGRDELSLNTNVPELVNMLDFVGQAWWVYALLQMKSVSCSFWRHLYVTQYLTDGSQFDFARVRNQKVFGQLYNINTAACAAF